MLRERLTAGTLPSCFAATAAERPEAPALEVDGAAASHGELDDRAARVAGFLREHGVAPGDRVLLCAPTSLDLVVAYLGTLRAGATAMPCDAALTADELGHLLGDAQPAAAFVAPDAREQPRARRHAWRPSWRSAGRGDGLPALADALEARPIAPEPDPGPAMLAYTSGTTGRPKGVPLSHADVLASIRAAMLAWRWSADDVLVHALPLSHQHGLSGVNIDAAGRLARRRRRRFEPAALCDAIAAKRRDRAVRRAGDVRAPRRVGGHRRGRLLLAAPGGLRLRAAVCPRSPSGSPRGLGQVPLERYGSTEAGLTSRTSTTARGGPAAWAGRCPAIELRLTDDGEILLRGPQVFGGYWQRPDATAEALSDDGWFRTGDLGRLDAEDGSLEITGRSKELIISGGLNVYPREVEVVLEEHPAVERVAVAGVPSERWGEEVVAFVVADGELDAEALIARCRERLSAYKCPKRVVVLDELPVNRMGKVRRDALATMAGDGD